MLCPASPAAALGDKPLCSTVTSPGPRLTGPTIIYTTLPYSRLSVPSSLHALDTLSTERTRQLIFCNLNKAMPEMEAESWVYAPLQQMLWVVHF